jgi:hypothetical protein
MAIAGAVALLAAVVVSIGARTGALSGAARSSASAQPADSVAPVCPLPDYDKGNLCHECRNTQCCAQYSACQSSHACGDYMTCVKACTGGPACKLACIQKYGEGHAIAAPYLACVGAKCVGPCADKNAALTCSSCQLANCADAANACLSDPDCDTLYACESTCKGGDDACSQKCKNAASPATQKRFNDFFFCAMLYCATTCK